MRTRPIKVMFENRHWTDFDCKCFINRRAVDYGKCACGELQVYKQKNGHDLFSISLRISLSKISIQGSSKGNGFHSIGNGIQLF